MPTSRKRNIELEFLIDDKRATKSLKNIEGQVTKTGKSFATAGKLLASGLVLDKVADFARGSIQSYSALNESLNAVEKTFGGAAEGIKRLGEEAADTLGLSNAEFNSLAVSFSAFASTVAEQSGRSVIPVMDELTTRAADFASVMDLDVTEAARLFQSGLAGETEPLRKFGKDLSAATVTAHAYAVGIAQSGEQLTEQQKVLARYSLLMEQTSDVQGDFADTADDLANQMRRNDAAAENAAATLGSFLAPAMQGAQDLGGDLVTVLAALADGFGQVDEKASKNSDTLQLFAGGALSIFNDAAELVADRIRDWQQAQKDQTQAALDALAPTEAQIKAAEGADKVFREQADALDQLADSTDDANTAAQKLADTQREASDPAFKLIQATERLEDAQDDYTEALAEYGPKSDQATDAALKLFDAQLDLNQASADFAAKGGKASIDALTEILENAGVLPDTIRAVIDAILEYNATPITRKSVFIPGVGNVTPDSGGSVGGGGTQLGFAHGGIVPGPLGAPVPATVHGGEMVLNRDQQKQLLKGNMGGGSVANITFVDVGVTTLAELQELYARQ